jgi:thymidine kinase
MDDQQNKNSMQKKYVTDPSWVMFIGPMFGSKTTRLVAAIDRYRYQNRSIAIFKPQMDTRYNDTMITTHAGIHLEAWCVKNGSDIIDRVLSLPTCDVVAVDEAFMIDDCAEALLSLFRSGKTIVVASLQLSASGKVFEEVRDMLPWATKIEVCPAVCPITGKDAYYTHRKIEGLDEITVGGSDLYEPRSWEYHHFMNQRRQ